MKKRIIKGLISTSLFYLLASANFIHSESLATQTPFNAGQEGCKVELDPENTTSHYIAFKWKLKESKCNLHAQMRMHVCGKKSGEPSSYWCKNVSGLSDMVGVGKYEDGSGTGKLGSYDNDGVRIHIKAYIKGNDGQYKKVVLDTYATTLSNKYRKKLTNTGDDDYTGFAEFEFARYNSEKLTRVEAITTDTTTGITRHTSYQWNPQSNYYGKLEINSNGYVVGKNLRVGRPQATQYVNFYTTVFVAHLGNDGTTEIGRYNWSFKDPNHN